MKCRFIDFVSVRLVVECVDQGSLIGAAGRCNITVSAASRRLNLFENLVGRKIFKRKHNGLELIESGRDIVLGLREILKRMENLIG